MSRLQLTGWGTWFTFPPANLIARDASEDDNGVYRTDLLPGLAVATTLFWQGEPPNMIEVNDLARAMLK